MTEPILTDDPIQPDPPTPPDPPAPGHLHRFATDQDGNRWLACTGCTWKARAGYTLTAGAKQAFLRHLEPA